jgi:hypothetical protein
MTEENQVDDVALAQEMYDRWQAGEKKSALEREYWNDGSSHGQAFSAFVREHLGLETVRQSPMAVRLQQAEGLLRVHGVSLPDEDLDEQFRLVARSREAALSALRVYNDPSAGFRTETFAILMIVAWNTLLQAICERDELDYAERDEDGEVFEINGRPKTIGTGPLAELVVGGAEYAALRANLDYWLGLRNLVAHRYLPELDALVVPEAQALLVNYESVLTAEFGDEASLGDRLAVPLHLSGFRSDAHRASLADLQAKLPLDVNDYLSRHRQEQPEEVRRDAAYSLRVFLVAVAANRGASADMTATFVKPEEVTDELLASLTDAALITKDRQVEVASKGLLRPKAVWEEVEARSGLVFTLNRHARACRHFAVRPFDEEREEHPDRTDARYCVYDELSDTYGYKRAWVEKLVREFAIEGRYREITGMEPEPAPNR